MEARAAKAKRQSALSWVNVALRGVLEAGIVAGLAWWGIHEGTGLAAKTVLGVAAPAVGFGIWGALDFRFAGRYAEPLRLIEELAISALAALALWVIGQRGLAIALAALSVLHHALVYTLGERLLKPRAHAPGANPEPVE